MPTIILFWDAFWGAALGSSVVLGALAVVVVGIFLREAKREAEESKARTAALKVAIDQTHAYTEMLTDIARENDARSRARDA